MLAIKQLQELCLLHNFSVSVADSCTGGGVSSAITSIPGSSKYFKGGIIAYQNETKINILGVSEDLIFEKSEVSVEVVETMAYNTLLDFNSDFSVATSGYAGPIGGNDINPVGTVFIAVSNRLDTITKRYSFQGDRQRVVNQATSEAILLLLSQIKKYK